MDSVLDDLHRLRGRLDSAARLFDLAPAKPVIDKLTDAANEIGEAWSGSWLGRSARVYKSDLQPKDAGDYWDDSGSAFSRTVGEWSIFTHDGIIDAVYERAGLRKRDFDALTEAGKLADTTFQECRAEFVPLLEAVLSDGRDATLDELRTKAKQMKGHDSASELATAIAPKQFFAPMDVMREGRQVPPHIAVMATILEECSYGKACSALSGLVAHASTYLEKKRKLKGQTVAKIEGPVFIGHGRSKLWLELKDFLTSKLKLEVIEFNSEPAAGIPTAERLEEMLGRAVFAFLLMTAEDQHADGTRHARENVVHEIGLFQGRLSFRRAIILLEDGCTEFSNIAGLTTIRFRGGDLKAIRDDIREVLAREKII